jgi:peptide/nickel transport system substrate-binding protein
LKFKIIPFIHVVILCLLSLSCGKQQSSRLYLKIGLHEEPKTLNIWLASDANSKKILSLIYQPLYLRDPDTFALIPWLAADLPEFHPDTISYTVRLRPAKWADGSEVTSEDVAFTANFIKEFRVPQYYSIWTFITKIETPGKYTVTFYLSRPKAMFQDRTLTTLIVEKKKWSRVAETARKQKHPLRYLLNYKIDDPMGCGPFVLKEWQKGAYLHLKENTYFFAKNKRINGRLIGPYIDDILFKIYDTSDIAILALKKGSIDMFWWGIQPGYLKNLQENKKIKVFLNKKSAVYFMGFNVRKKPFDDVNLRRAIAVLIDKDFIISRILQGYGIRMDSIVPPANQYWFCPDVYCYGKGLHRKDRIKKAYQMLHNAGYSWEVPPVGNNGEVVPGKGMRTPDGRLMERFTILTPPADYDPLRAMTGTMIQGWLRAMGMPAFSKPMAFGALLEKVKGSHEFDAFVLGYGSLSLDPDYLRNFFHSANDKPGGWNMSGYKNKSFDQLADLSASEMNPENRKKLIWKMQEIVTTDVPYIPLYNPTLIEAVRRDTFRGWVNMADGIGNIWSFCRVKPIR